MGQTVGGKMNNRTTTIILKTKAVKLLSLFYLDKTSHQVNH